MSSPFFANMEKQMKEKSGGTMLAAIAPPSASQEVVVAPAILPKEECVLLPIPTQPKSGKDVCPPIYDEETHKVKQLGIRLSLAPDNVPCAYYHHNKRLMMGVTLMHALDEQGEVQNIPFNVKEKDKQLLIDQARAAIRDAFAIHRADPDLTHAKLLNYANLYDGQTLGVNYQTYERTINELLGSGPAPPIPSTRKRSPSQTTAPKEDEVEDEDDGLISGVGSSSKKGKENVALDGDVLALAEELGLNEEEDAVFAFPPLEEEEEVIPVIPVKIPVKRSAPVKELPDPPSVKKAKTMDATFVRALLYKILQHENESDERLWKALQSESLDQYFIDRLEKELKEKKSSIQRDFLMAKLFAMLRHAVGKPEEELWDLTGRILGL